MMFLFGIVSLHVNGILGWLCIAQPIMSALCSLPAMRWYGETISAKMSAPCKVVCLLLQVK